MVSDRIENYAQNPILFIRHSGVSRREWIVRLDLGDDAGAQPSDHAFALAADAGDRAGAPAAGAGDPAALYFDWELAHNEVQRNAMR